MCRSALGTTCRLASGCGPSRSLRTSTRRSSARRSLQDWAWQRSYGRPGVSDMAARPLSIAENPSIDDRKRQRALDAYRAFLTTPLDGLLAGGDPHERALRLFRDVAASVPAYGEFLRDHDVDPAEVRTADDFALLPLTTKEGYLRRHALADLCRGGSLEGCDMAAVSSGSTGEPTVWPRFLSDELAGAVRFEQVFHDSFEAEGRRTLAVVCFALGTWVGGMYTAACCRHLAAKGYRIVVVTPGNNKDEILRVVGELGPAFEQGRPARLPALREGRHRHRPRPRHRLAALRDQ